jgi:hypothetical protein
MIVVRRRRWMVGCDDIDLGCGNTATGHFAEFEMCAHIQLGGGLLKKGEGHAGVDKRAEQHVPAYAGKTLKISNTHRQ